MSEAPIPYKVSYSGLVRAEVRRLIDTAATPVRARAILDAFREFDRVLRIYPQFGEPERDLQHGDGQIYNAIVPPVVLRYAIVEERRLVMVNVLPVLLPMRSEEPEAE